MSVLTDIADRVRDCIVAAWVDARTGEVLERHALGAEPLATTVLEAATEVIRSPERPPRMVLLSAKHVHIVQRAPGHAYRTLVVICDRSPNLGLAVALVRSIVAPTQAIPIIPGPR